jgi:hypothetical protein
LNRLTEDFLGRRRNLESSNVNNQVQFEVLSKTIISSTGTKGLFKKHLKLEPGPEGPE